MFYVANQLKYTKVLAKNPEAIKPWMAFFKFVLDLEVPADSEDYTDMPHIIEKRNKTGIWRLKFEAARIIHHMFNKYGMVDYVNDGEMPFHKQLLNDFLDPFL